MSTTQYQQVIYTESLQSTIIKDNSYVFTINNSEEDAFLEDPQLATAMREGTKVMHKAAENSIFTKRFLKGEINKDEYGQYLRSLYFIYKTMEELLEKHKHNPAIEMIYFPKELNRTQALLEDLGYYYGKHRLAEVTDASSMSPAVERYVASLEKACAIHPALLIAHSYSRYLGDLSGGQLLAKRLKKHVLGLNESDGDWDSEEGLEFYRFTNIGNHQEFKAIYRERLNAAKVNAKTRDLIVDEAVRSFELNIGVFDEVHALSQANKLLPTVGNTVTNSPVDRVRSATFWVTAVTAVAISAAVCQRYMRFTE
ncbi:Heme oxygenase 2 [Apophysomyces ossiformis]|uniref:heme oxygenase (biliverdin-producing) n=1 Tax=Apophysomyces ossiformis TaxID=679940 RepID=A0A8H7BXE1_9FUNG|nr:Heme oxygenase 2 [Apophysomyces ossiformis]